MHKRAITDVERVAYERHNWSGWHGLMGMDKIVDPGAMIGPCGTNAQLPSTPFSGLGLIWPWACMHAWCAGACPLILKAHMHGVRGPAR